MDEYPIMQTFLQVKIVRSHTVLLKMHLQFFSRKDVKYLTYAPPHGILYVVVYVTDFPLGIPL